jgi:N-methylhydantoinase A
MSYRVGVDVGGTFTDIVMFDERTNALHLTKVPSTVRNQSIGVVEGIRKLTARCDVAPEEIEFLIHGTTVATNALLERKGVPCALITTQGCRDILQIARQDRPSLYDSFARRPAALTPRRRRFEVRERMRYTGDIETPLDDAQAIEIIEQIKREGVDAIAVCLLHSYANPAHERRIGELIRTHYPEATVSLSHEVLSEFKEYERMSTTLVNVYVMPIVKRYLDDLEASVHDLGIRSPLHIMQSNGGVMTAATAAQRSVQTILSGPAAGVVGALAIAGQVGAEHIISIDMGGTSLDVSLCHGGRMSLTMENEVADLPVKAPMIDIHTLGAGGGSIGWIDPGGALRVGPQSAGAEPGPACYRRGCDLPTVTDANLVLGRLSPDYFVGGEMQLDLLAAREAIERVIAAPLGLTVERAAAGMIEVVNATMVKGMRYVSVERGFDPREFTVIAFGGAGPLHATALAAELDAPRVISPPMPGVTSALGLLVADFRHDYSQTYLCALHDVDLEALNRLYAGLEAEALAQMGREGIAETHVVFSRSVDARYLGQGYELEVAAPAGVLDETSLQVVQERFLDAHRRHYGYVKGEDEAVQLVNLRLTATGRLARPQFARSDISPGAMANPARALKGQRQVYFAGEYVPTPIYERSSLLAGDIVDGPAVIEQVDSTTLLGRQQRATVDGFGNLIIDLPRRTEER